MVLTQSRPELITEPLRKRGIGPDHSLVCSVPAVEIPRYLKAADLAISFIKPCYSKLSSSPTKLAEYLAAGLPVICSAGIGDIDEVIENDWVGVLVRDFSREAYRLALAEAENLRQDPHISDRCRASASRRFDLEQVGGMRYRRLYRRLLAHGEIEPVPSPSL
jgi:glycosyltransferase involved in cell wall biosynthesis